jgi:predicted permease
MTLRDLTLRIRALFAPRRVEQELDAELAFHIDRETEKHIAAGLSPSDARARALARFGPVALAADRCRDVRGITVVDTLVRDVLYAFRSFRRARLAAITIITTVGLGLGLVTVVFTFYNALFLRADAVRNPGELFAVQQLPAPGARAWVPFTRATYEALRAETSVFADTLAMFDDMPARVDGRPVSATLVTGNFFQMLGATAELGRTLTPADNDRSAIVLSHRGWKKLYAGDPAVVGRGLLLNGAEYEIVGVMPEGFRGLRTSAPDGWAPLTHAGQFRPAYARKEDTMAIEVVGRLKPGMSPDTAAAGLALWAQQRGLEIAPGRRVHMALWPTEGTISQETADTLKTFVPLFFAFGLILIIGCANVANLLLARGVSRQREIGIRLSLGASRQHLVRQLLTESFLLAIAAAACGFAVSRVFLAGALHAINVTMPPEIAELAQFQAPAADWRVVAFLVAGAALSTVVFGLVPALHATRLEVVRTMRGEVTRDARPGRARQSLIAIQVGASALLLISAAVFLRGAVAASREDVGVRTSDTVAVTIANEPRRPALLQTITAHPSVAAVAAASQQQALAKATSLSGEPRTTVPVDCMFVSPEYFDVLEIPVLRGRSFTASERTTDAGVVVVSDTVARRLWPDRDAIGQVMRLDDAAGPRPGRESRIASLPSRTFTVVGVARDVRGSFLVLSHSLMFTGVYLPAGPESPGMSLMLRVRGDPGDARRALLGGVTAVDPTPVPIRTMRAMTGMQTYVLRVAFSVTVALGAIALALTLSGLFSVLSYLVEQRRKEIGVRMALGATTRSVARLVVGQSLFPVGGGLLAGGGLAAALGMVLMSLPIASLIVHIVQVFDPVAYVVSLLVIVIGCLVAAFIPAMRAARIDPIAALRQD